MLTALAWCLAGLVLLVAGADLLVHGGTRIAERLNISPAVIGLTLVAIGTSAPELAIGIDAALQGHGDMAVGNIAGTNVVNILLILGLSALMIPVPLRTETLRLDLPMIVAASLVLMAMAWDGFLSRSEGFLLVAGALIYTAAIVRIAHRESKAVQVSYATEIAEGTETSSARHLGRNLFRLVAGIAIVVVAADWLVYGAVQLARLWGVSDAFIGVTIVAIGTSAPELVTTIVSTLRRQRDIAIGNLLGSSVYNVLFILGLTCIAAPSGITVSRVLVTVDIPVMAAVALVCVPAFWTGRKVSRTEGALFVSAYIFYLSYLVAART